jgi:hypothetical protein
MDCGKINPETGMIEHEGDSFYLYDARGIYVAKVCDYCEKEVKSKYRPEIFDDGGYEADEPIEPEDY